MGLFGSHLGLFGSHLGPLENHLGPFRNQLRDSWCHLVVKLVDSDSQNKCLLERVRESVMEGVRLPDLELLLCVTELELKTKKTIKHNKIN